MTFEEQVSVIEAIIFASGDPIETERLASASGMDKALIPKLCERLSERYKSTKSSLQVLRLDNSWQICTQESFAPYIKNALESKRQSPLSQAAMEVLAIIAYNQPVTKSFIEHVRGIESGTVVNNLAERGLVEEAGRLDLPGKPIAFRTTSVFLRSFKLKSLDDLPALPNKSEQISFDDADYENTPDD